MTRRTINAAGRDIIKLSEGLSLQAYPDPATGDVPWTIGWGHTGPDVHKGLKITRDQAEDLLARDLARFEDGVAEMCPVATDNQFAAMVSLSFNIGLSNFRTSTLRRMHNEGNHAGAAGQFARWSRAGGKVMRGLVKRRAAEAELYARP